MKKILILMIPLFFGALLMAHTEEPTPSKNKGVLWHSITVIDLKPGTTGDVKALIEKFEAASESAGTAQAEIYWFESGKYDMIVTWKLNEEVSDFQGKWSPFGERWWNALVELEGSEDAAIKLQDDYNQLVATSLTSVARVAQ